MKTITLYPVWAWAVVHGHKPVENRTWRTHYRGPLLIHAAADSPVARARDKIARRMLEALGIDVPAEVPRGAIVGAVTLVDVTRQPVAHPLATGPFCWLFARPRCFAVPVQAKGRLGLWNLTGEVATVVSRCYNHE